MKGIELREVRDALTAAFNQSALDQMLRFRLDLDRKNMVADGPFNDVTYNLLLVAEQEGWDAALVEAAFQERRGNKKIQEMYRKYGVAVVAAYREQADDDKVRDTYRKYGLAPEGYPDEPRLGQLEKVIRSTNPWLNMAEWLEQAARVEGHVCRIELQGQPMGTGFLVGPDMVLTNYHVLKPVLDGQVPPEAVSLRFDYKQLSGGMILSGELFHLAAGWRIDDSPCTSDEEKGTPDASAPQPDQLDYALFRVDGAPGQKPLKRQGGDGPVRGWVQVPTAAYSFAVHSPLFIVQHPQGTPLKLALDTDAVLGVNANGTRVRYRTNTDNGSSGSPCFQANWDLVALHHYGDPAYGHPKYNQGVPITAIRALLKNRGKESALAGQSP